jgi:rhamnose utilization protein RhaD (predicted bifunctional aldolase and dehydrogenase)
MSIHDDPDHDDPEYRALLAYAAGIGADRALVQGAGGNVSLKRDGVLWVKASGTWLADALRGDIMVPVRLAPMLAELDSPAAEDTARHVVTERNPSGLRPSIETTMHGALPHPVVVHVHCVETLAWAARADAATALAPLLAGLRWVFVPYVRPGAPLTRAILARTAPDTDVIVLGNHGLVVGGADTAAAAALLAEVCRRLRRPARPAPPPDPAALAEVAERTGHVPVSDPLTHAIATDPATLAVARRGSFYPDHVIFLGPGIAVWPAPPRGRPAPLLAVPGAGVLLAADASAGAVALAGCLGDVAARIDPAEELVALTPAQEAELLGWDAEKYRQGLDRP